MSSQVIDNVNWKLGNSQFSTQLIVHPFSLYLTNTDIGTLGTSIKGFLKSKWAISKVNLHWPRPLNMQGNHFMIEIATWIWKWHNHLFSLTSHFTGCWIRTWLNKQLSLVISSENCFVTYWCLSFTSVTFQNMGFRIYILSISPLPQVFVGFQPLSLVCWVTNLTCCLENFFTTTLRHILTSLCCLKFNKSILRPYFRPQIMTTTDINFHFFAPSSSLID